MQEIITPYDSEVLAWERIQHELEEIKKKGLINPQDFVDIAVEKFAQVGTVVDVRCFSTGNVVGHHPITGEEMVEEVPNLWTFEIQIRGRADAAEFDHDKMAAEVRGDILGLNDGPNVIKAEKNLDEVVRQYTKGHTH